MYGAPTGTVVVTANGYLTTTSVTDAGSTTVLLPTGTRVFNIHLVSTSTPSVLKISNGQTGTVAINVTGTASIGSTFDFGFHGHSFPNGAYVTVDANIVTAAISCRADQF